MAKEKRGETTKVNNRDDHTDGKKRSESPSQVRRSDDSTPVNRNAATDSVSPQIVFPFPDMERTVFAGIEMETAGNQYIFSKNMGENGGRNKESGVEKENSRQHGNNRKSSNMRGRVRMGLGQPKHISLDSRPSSKKRPRLDIDQSGLDPFGLDILLGMHQNTQGDTEGNQNSNQDGGKLLLKNHRMIMGKETRSMETRARGVTLSNQDKAENQQDSEEISKQMGVPLASNGTV
ncbi:hypothetical protein Hanom_Chr17g01542731 [Helianthus anomalus]